MKLLVKEYFTTALWASTGPDGEPLDSTFSLEDVSKELILEAEKDIELFLEKAGALLDGLDLSTVMHDFWITRNGHGGGFWDGDYTESIGEALTKISHSFGKVELYVGNNNKLYRG